MGDGGCVCMSVSACLLYVHGMVNKKKESLATSLHIVFLPGSATSELSLATAALAPLLLEFPRPCF